MSPNYKKNHASAFNEFPGHKQKRSASFLLWQLIVSIMGLLLSGAIANAQQAPDMRGVWVRVSGSGVSTGIGTHYPSTCDDSITGIKKGKNGICFRQNTDPNNIFDITQQEGRSFAGTFESKTRKAQIMGTFAEDLKGGVMVDESGSLSFTMLSADKLGYCFTAVKNQHLKASCAEFKRKPK